MKIIRKKGGYELIVQLATCEVDLLHYKAGKLVFKFQTALESIGPNNQFGDQSVIIRGIINLDINTFLLFGSENCLYTRNY